MLLFTGSLLKVDLIELLKYLKASIDAKENKLMIKYLVVSDFVTVEYLAKDYLESKHESTQGDFEIGNMKPELQERTL